MRLTLLKKFEPGLLKRQAEGHKEEEEAHGT